MWSLGAAGSGGGVWGMGPFHRNIGRRNNKKRDGKRRESKPSNSADSAAAGGGGGGGGRFPLKQALTSGSLCLAGDTIAQLRHRWVRDKHTLDRTEDLKDTVTALFSEHDYTRALRMASYGFILYGPGSYAWYQLLDHFMPHKNLQNLTTKVILNQVILGPIVVGVVFAWNNLWQGKLSELPNKYKNDAVPTLLTGLKFWVPVSILNFGAVPLQARVAFMSMSSIFWNFYLSTTMNR